MTLNKDRHARRAAASLPPRVGLVPRRRGENFTFAGCAFLGNDCRVQTNSLPRTGFSFLWSSSSRCMCTSYDLRSRHRHTNPVAILVLNFTLGWTMLSWIGALVWSFTRKS